MQVAVSHSGIHNIMLVFHGHSSCMDSVLEAADCFGVPAVLNYDDKQLDVCSSCKIALSSQHSTD